MSLAALLLLSACGGDGPTEPTGPPLPNIAGTYIYGPGWVTDFKRIHDGYSGWFRCAGRITIVQAPGSSRITGFVEVIGGGRCSWMSFPLTGTVDAGGAVSIVMRGPRPLVGPCPTPGETTFTGVVGRQREQGSFYDTLSARGRVKLDCPGPGEGEYTFDQLIEQWKLAKS